MYDLEQEPLKAILFNELDENIKFNYIRKEGNSILFIISAAVDDEEGIIFINDEANNTLDGIKTLKRIGGNSYSFSTRD